MWFKTKTGLRFLTKRNARKLIYLTGGGESKKAAERRRAKARQKYKEKRANETDLAKNARNEKRRERETNLPEDIRSQRRERNNLSQSQVRQRETAEHHEVRLTQDRLSQRIRRANETPEEYEVRITQDRLSHMARRVNETQDQYESRLERDRESHSCRRANETLEQHEARLTQDRLSQRIRRANETPEEYEARITQDRLSHMARRVNETQDQYESRLERDRESHSCRRANETLEQHEARLTQDRLSQRIRRANETPEEYEARITQDRLSHMARRVNETQDQYESRLERDRESHSCRRANETPEQHQARLEHDRETQRVRRAQQSASVDAFKAAINTFCDRVCDVCRKMCYPTQITRCTPSNAAMGYLPDELADKGVLEVCFRCKTHLTSNKPTHPSKAYWNSLDPGEIPEEIRDLSYVEKRLLCRIKAFVRIVRLQGRFGQLGFKGQAILFAQDIFEVTEALPNMLPISTQESGIVVVTECLENIESTREFTVSRDKLFRALRWLIANNPLYQDVTIDENVRIEQSDIVRVQAPRREVPEPRGQYKECNDVSRILQASFHQGNPTIFRETAGKQCCAMAFANIVRACITPPRQWTKMMYDENLFSGDDIYQKVVRLTEELPGALRIDQNGYLCVRHLSLLKDEFELYEKLFEFDCANDPSWYGSLRDEINFVNRTDREIESGFMNRTLAESLEKLFDSHTAGIFIASSKCFGIIKSEGKYYFTDSHACGVKGATCIYDENGRACVIECQTFEELVRVCKRATSIRTSIRNKPYTLDYIDVRVKIVEEPCVEEEQTASSIHNEQSVATQMSLELRSIPIQTSMMAPTDMAQPDLEDHVEVADNLNEIRRKTTNNIVNIRQEPKHEEFAWFHLFPYGKNGLMEDSRAVYITPLDYFQSRILSNDPRFQSSNYLFYALSMKELSNVKSMISTCAKKVRNRDGAIDDVHLIMRNVRGSSAYWRNALTDLIAQIRCLGPPTYFITLSCNDLNWTDMRIALLKADGRGEVDPSSLTINEVQLLVEKYPVIVSRHFMIRLNAFMKYIKSTDVLGGKVKDYWWRIEFQNRGSPHAHMLFWVENHPDFDTPEGIEALEKVVTCAMPEEGSELYELVKKCQIHKHTATCNKNDPNIVCRFGFPRRESDVTKIISTTSDEFIRNNNRTCVLKRTRHERWVNNYNPSILQVWEGNMDIQPCGTNEAVAYYVAKYLGKCEPENMDPAFAQAIRDIRREDSNISLKLFKICMKILNERQISACEAVFRLSHLPLRGSSRKTVFLNTRMEDQRYHVLQFGADDQGMGFFLGLIERYQQRPLEPQHGFSFEDMSLLEFAMMFEPYYPKRAIDTEENIDHDAYGDEDENTRRRLIKLQNNMKMTIRTTPAVVKVPYFIAANDPQNYYYSLLLQYKPFRQESELLEGYDTAREAFLANETELMQISERMRTYRERDRQLEIAFNQAHAFQVLQEPEAFDIGDDEGEELDMNEHVMNNDEFTTAQQAMNIGQRELFNRITQSIADQLSGSEHRERLFITGGAGTGKTFLFNVLKNQVSRCYGDEHGLSSVKVAALSGVAAHLVGGATLHSMLKLPIQKLGQSTVDMPPLTGIYLTNMRRLWKDVKFLFIDEISLVSYKVLTQIDARLKELKNNSSFFGGLNILVFGDLMQLPPVQGNPVFKQNIGMQPATHLWHLFGLVELTQNMRQQGDTIFVDLLNALRVGEMRQEHFQILMRKVVIEDVGEFAIDKALRIKPTNDMVDSHNARVIEKFQTEDGVRMFTIIAQDQLVDSTRTVTAQQLARMVPKDIRLTGGLPRELTLFVGAKVMLRANIDISKGLVNGNIGHITEIIWPLFRRAQVYANDIPSVKVDFGKDGIHLIEPKSLQFPAAKASDGLVERRMLPIILSWASTVHKMQGCTVDLAKIYLGPKLFERGQAYVSLSRVRSLDGLQIDELDCSRLMGKGCCNTEALAEMERMRNYQPPPM